MREVQAITTDESGTERHPAFAMIGASRGSWSPPGTVLFDSDIRHQNTVTIRIKAATRKRSLHRDYIHGEKQYIEVELSEAQWASFVSTMNVGDGVPCTVRYRQVTAVGGGLEEVPYLPYAPKLAETMQETRAAADEAFGEIKEALAHYQSVLTVTGPGAAKVKRTALDNLVAKINNAVPNVTFAGKQLTEQVENVVQKARADIEAFVLTKANQLGLNPAELRDVDLNALTSGPEADPDWSGDDE